MSNPARLVASAHPRRRSLPLAALAFGLSFACWPTGDATAQSVSAPLVQDTFSLREPDDALVPAGLADLARETQAAIVLTSDLELTETTAAWGPGVTLGERWDLCEGQPFAEQTTYAICGATLIASDLVLTAEHCVTDQRTCDGISFVFGYEWTGTGPAPLSRDDVYSCAGFVERSERADYAIIALDREVVGRTPPTIRYMDPATCRGVLDEERVWGTGFPSGVPLKVDIGDRDFMDLSVALGVEVTESNIGSGRFFRAKFDLHAGMDGSGVFADDLTLVGYLSSGRDDYVLHESGCYTSNLKDDDPLERAGHIIQPFIAYCSKNPDSPLCPAEVMACEKIENHVDVGPTAFPPPQGCGCRLAASPVGEGERERAPTPIAALALLGLLLTRARRRARRCSRRS